MNVSLSDSITDLASLIANYEPSELDTGMTTTQLRTRLTSANYADPQFRLWSREQGCLSDYDPSPVCVTSGQYTFGNMGNIRDPFWAQLPSGFSTGLVQQFAPCVNFTSKYENITAAEFPENCDQIQGALFYHYDNRTEYDGYAIDVCMPYNVSVSPWKAQRSRQDFTEELYLNITFSGFDAKSLQFKSSTPKAGTYAFKATLTTTGGYFELPNYMNGHLPGPLLDDDPEPHCGQQCPDQYFEPIGPDSVTRDVFDDPIPSYPYRSLAYIMNKGPLVSIALALFGPGSYLDIRRTVIEAYQHRSEDFIGCVAIVPIMDLLTAPHEDAFQVSESLGPCVDSTHLDLFDILSSYIWLFAASSGNNLPSAERIQDALTASAFLAVDIWFGSTLGAELFVSNKPSDDLQIPFISPAGVVLVSVVLGIYLTFMLALSVYSAWTPRWTNQLDSFAMMRIGGSLPRRVPFLLAHSPGKVDALDKLPGWIGDVAGAQGGEVNRVGELGLGGEAPVKRGARYRCYPVNTRTESESSDTEHS